MKKISLVAAVLVASVTLNAATVASVNGKNISDTEVNEFFAPMLGGRDINTLPGNQKKALIDQYVIQELILADAKKQNLERDPLYARQLERAKENVLINVYQEKILNEIKVDPSQVRAFYDKNKNNYVRPPMVRAKHILVKTQKEAQDIIKQLSNLKGKALEDKFSEIARKQSLDQGSGAQGGELGWFDQSSSAKPFTDVAFSLKNGEINKTPVKTEFGYHVILKEGSQPKQQLKFEDVRNGIEELFKAEEFKRIINQKGQDLLSKAKVEYK